MFQLSTDLICKQFGEDLEIDGFRLTKRRYNKCKKRTNENIKCTGCEKHNIK